MVTESNFIFNAKYSKLFFPVRYIVQAAHVDDPQVLLSQEDLGGSQSEGRDPKVKEIVRNLIQIGDELNRNAELQ